MSSAPSKIADVPTQAGATLLGYIAKHPNNGSRLEMAVLRLGGSAEVAWDGNAFWALPRDWLLCGVALRGQTRFFGFFGALALRDLPVQTRLRYIRHRRVLAHGPINIGEKLLTGSFCVRRQTPTQEFVAKTMPGRSTFGSRSDTINGKSNCRRPGRVVFFC